MGLTQSMLSWPMVLPTPSISCDGAAARMNRQPCEAGYADPSAKRGDTLLDNVCPIVGVMVSLYDP